MTLASGTIRLNEMIRQYRSAPSAALCKQIRTIILAPVNSTPPYCNMETSAFWCRVEYQGPFFHVSDINRALDMHLGPTNLERRGYPWISIRDAASLIHGNLLSWGRPTFDLDLDVNIHALELDDGALAQRLSRSGRIAPDALIPAVRAAYAREGYDPIEEALDEIARIARSGGHIRVAPERFSTLIPRLEAEPRPSAHARAAALSFIAASGIRPDLARDGLADTISRIEASFPSEARSPDLFRRIACALSIGAEAGAFNPSAEMTADLALVWRRGGAGG